MTASLFGTASPINANVNGSLTPQVFIATAGQTLFTLTAFSYTLSTSSLLVFLNGKKLTLGRDFTETSATSFTLLTATTVNDVVEAIGFPQVTADASGIFAAFLATGSGKGTAAINYLPGGIGASPRNLEARLQDNPLATDFSSLLVAASSGLKNIAIPAGNYTVSANLSIPIGITMVRGAKIIVAAGVTLAFTRAFSAGVYQVFDCTAAGASVTFDPAKVQSGYAEWWGAATNDSASGTQAINIAAINAALVALRKVELMPATYWTNARVYMGIGYRELKGAGEHYDGTNNGQATRVLCTSASSTLLQMGPDAYPGSINALPEQLFVHDILFDRVVAPSISADAQGVRVQYVLRSQLKNVRSEQSIYGFRYYGCVYTKVDDCDAFRSVAGTGGTDRFWGHYIDGSATISGLNGGNASLYLNRCAASIGNITISDSSGFYADSVVGFTDLFLAWPETTGMSTGINIQGNASNTTLNATNLDLQIVNPILDQFTFTGIFIKNVNKFGGVEVSGGYYGPNAAATACIYIQTSLGATNIRGGQCVLGGATTTLGVIIDTCAAVSVNKLTLLECTATGISITASNNCDIRPIIKNQSVGGGAAVQISGATTACYIQPQISGKANGTQYGIQVIGASDARNEYNVSLIDSACLPAANRKLDRNGTPVTAIGATGTNYATGVFA